MSQSLTTAEWLTKKLYRGGLDEEALTGANALYKWIEKKTDFSTSQGITVPAPYSNSQGLGSTFAAAATAEAGRKGVAFLVPQRKIYHYGKLDADLVINTEAAGSEQQYINVLTAEIDGATANFGSEINERLYRSVLGGRALVHASTAPSTVTLTLANPEDAQFFEVDMLVAAVKTSDGTLRNSGAAVLLTAVDYIAGTLTASTDWTTTIAALAVGDTLIRASNHNASLDGLEGWVPTTVASNDSFMGVNRFPARVRLAGVYADVSDRNIRPALLKAFGLAELQLGQKFNNTAPIFMNPIDVTGIKESVEAIKVVNTVVNTKYEVGLNAVEVLGHTIISDRHCPRGQAYLVPKGSFTLSTAGAQPAILDQLDGRKFNFNRTSGFLEFSMGLHGNSYSTMINSIMRIALPTML